MAGSGNRAGVTLVAAGAWFVHDRSLRDAAAAVTLTKANEKSVGVLAFANLGGNKDDEYFTDGISEELLNVIARVPGLRVSARTSAFSFKGKQVQIAEIGRQLGVAHVVEGSVRRSGNRVRITAQLVNSRRQRVPAH